MGWSALATPSVIIASPCSSVALESSGSRVAVQCSPRPLAPDDVTGAVGERPWPLRSNTGLGGVSWAAIMWPSRRRAVSRPSSPARTATAAPAQLGRSGPGSNCRVGSWNRTVLSLATFLRCLKRRIRSRHSSGSSDRNAGSGCCGGTWQRRLNRDRNCSSTRLAAPLRLAPASRSSVTSRS